MNLEELDGFFAALIAGPETVMPSEYNREVFGGEISETCEFSSLDEASEILGLMMRHWNTIAGTLLKDEVYVPLLLEGEDGVAQGNDWAGGFMRGMHMRHDGWAELVNDEEHGGCLIPKNTPLWPFGRRTARHGYVPASNSRSLHTPYYRRVQPGPGLEP